MQFYFNKALLGINEQNLPEFLNAKDSEVIVKNGGMNSPKYCIETTITPVYQSFAALFDRPSDDFSKQLYQICSL